MVFDFFGVKKKAVIAMHSEPVIIWIEPSMAEAAPALSPWRSMASTLVVGRTRPRKA